MNITRNLIVAVLMTLVTTILLGIVYPLVITGLAQVIFPDAANGQLIEQHGRIIGSRIIGQAFSSPGYFRSRPSAAGNGYDATASAGTNKGPTDRKLADSLIGPRADSLVAAGVARGSIPTDAVTASASGLDPHISPANAYLQVARVAKARGVDSAAVRRVLDAHVEGRQFGFFGEPRVNVLMLNIALDSAFAAKRTARTPQ